MATRRRSSSSTSPKTEETASVEEFLDESAREMFETISQTESEVEEKPEVVEPEEKPEAVEAKPFVPLEIVPTEDAGPRFVEITEAPPQPQVTPPAPKLQPGPKRHPRNVPKFSRYK